MTVGQLLHGGGPTCMTGLAHVSVVVGTTPTTVELKCFPRAAEKLKDGWREEQCPMMPAAEAAPWRAILLDPFNTCYDSLLCLPAHGCGLANVVLALQNKEYVKAASATDQCRSRW